MDGEITATELKALLDDDEDVRLVDIRNQDAFDRGHIPDSDNIPFKELPQRVEEFDDDEHIVTICPVGKSSIQAARLIGSYEGASDTTVESLANGLQGWDYSLKSNASNSSTDPSGEPNAPF